MARLAVAMDLGTSGFRAQALDLSSGEIISTAITTRHPLPGDNLVDHIKFSLERGVETARCIVVEGINRVLRGLRIPLDEVGRFGVCGNPAQLSLLQGIEIRDLAYSGIRKLQALGVAVPRREARMVPAVSFQGLHLPSECLVIVPPAVRHEIGADALALIIQTGMLKNKGTALAIDFGTNAEMALLHKGTVITGSAAAGPALEGRQITCGRLAMPGVIADLQPANGGEPGGSHRLVLLNDEMMPVTAALVDLRKKGMIDGEDTPRPIGITGTGTVAIIEQAIGSGLIALPHIATADHLLHLGEEIFLTEDDLVEAGKAFGAVRAGYSTLCHEAGITPQDVPVIYMSGASGTYVDALKAQRLGMIPPHLKTVYQVGNTSLAMARDLVTDPGKLAMMSELAEKFRETHCMFAASSTFKKIFILEFSHWTEGMPMDRYRELLRRYGLSDLLPVQGTPRIIRTVQRDISDLGREGMVTITDIGRAADPCLAPV